MARRTVRSWVGAHIREMRLVVSALRRRRRDLPTVLIMPGEDRTDGASNLRGYLIADALGKYGWNAFVCPKQLSLSQRRRAISLLRPDLILMQMARHPDNLPRLYAPVPVVFDIDDADYVDDRQRPRVIEALESSAAVIAGSRSVASFCAQHNANVEVVWTGTPITSGKPRLQADRPRIVTWAALLPWNCPGEAEFVLEVLRSLLKRTKDFEFRLYCDDGSLRYRDFAARFEATGARIVTSPLIADYREFLHSLEDVAVGLAPLVDVDSFSGGKSFGKVLAYMDSGVPVLTHAVVDHTLFFRNGENGFLADTAQEWADIAARLLDDPAERQRVADAARADLQQRLSTAESARRVDHLLRRVIGARANA